MCDPQCCTDNDCSDYIKTIWKIKSQCEIDRPFTKIRSSKTFTKLKKLGELINSNVNINNTANLSLFNKPFTIKNQTKGYKPNQNILQSVTINQRSLKYQIFNGEMHTNGTCGTIEGAKLGQSSNKSCFVSTSCSNASKYIKASQQNSIKILNGQNDTLITFNNSIVDPTTNGTSCDNVVSLVKFVVTVQDKATNGHQGIKEISLDIQTTTKSSVDFGTYVTVIWEFKNENQSGNSATNLSQLSGDQLKVILKSTAATITDKNYENEFKQQIADIGSSTGCKVTSDISPSSQTMSEIQELQYKSIADSEMLVELKVNQDVVVTCEYPDDAQCKSNPLLQMWNDFNRAGDSQLQVLSGDQTESATLDSHNAVSATTDSNGDSVAAGLTLDGEGEDNCLTGLGFQFQVYRSGQETERQVVLGQQVKEFKEARTAGKMKMSAFVNWIDVTDQQDNQIDQQSPGLSLYKIRDAFIYPWQIQYN